MRKMGLHCETDLPLCVAREPHSPQLRNGGSNYGTKLTRRGRECYGVTAGTLRCRPCRVSTHQTRLRLITLFGLEGELMEIRSKELLQRKVDDSKAVIRQAYERFNPEHMVAAWTGGKDSTLLMWLIREVCREDGRPIPNCFLIDEGDMFPEVKEFVKELSDAWKLQVTFLHNSNVSQAAGGELGAPVHVANLNERNRRELERLGFEDDEFDYEPESFVGNHLMKTVPLLQFLEEQKVEAFFEGIRWDEQEARANETYFSERAATEYGPAHMRVFPILHFLEREVWEAHFAYDIPICELYKHGYRSLGARGTTRKTTDVPAWEQDLDNTSERGGRQQDKEGVMQKLRELGYM